MLNDKEIIKKLENENKELRSQLFRFRSIYNASIDIIILLDAKSERIININTAVTQLLGYSVEELIGNSISVIFDETTAGMANEYEFFDSVLTNRKVHKKDGSYRLMDMTFTMINIDDTIYHIINLRDAEERARAEKELKDFSNRLEITNKTKDKFFSIIAHDLKNPFGSLMGLSELLEEDFYELSDEEKLSYISEMRKVSKGSYQLLENLLEWSRAQTGQITYQPSELDLKFLLMEVMGLVQAQAKAKDIEIKIIFVEDFVVYADDDLLMTVIRNLLTNAIKYSHYGQKILIDAKKLSDSELELAIIDFGVGISEEQKSTLFTFDKGESRPGTNNEKGTGLGLVLCKEFIELNRGKIRYDSTKDYGTTFFITIPLLFSE